MRNNAPIDQESKAQFCATTICAESRIVSRMRNPRAEEEIRDQERAALRARQLDAMKQILEATNLKSTQLARNAGIRPSTLNKPLGKGVKHVWSVSTIGKIVIHLKKHAREYAEKHPHHLPVELTIEKINAGVKALASISPYSQQDTVTSPSPEGGVFTAPSLGHNSAGVHDNGAEPMGARDELMKLLVLHEVSEETAAGILQIIKSYKGGLQARPPKRGRT